MKKTIENGKPSSLLACTPLHRLYCVSWIQFHRSPKEWNLSSLLQEIDSYSIVCSLQQTAWSSQRKEHDRRTSWQCIFGKWVSLSKLDMRIYFINWNEFGNENRKWKYTFSPPSSISAKFKAYTFFIVISCVPQGHWISFEGYTISIKTIEITITAFLLLSGVFSGIQKFIFKLFSSSVRSS